MSSCAGCSTNSKQDLDRWTSSLSNVLDSPRARKKFNDFLSHRRLDEAELTLHFWETCNRILLEASHNEQLKHGGPINMNIVPHARFHKDFSKLVEFAEENINFDAHQLRLLRRTLNQANITDMVKMTSAAQSTAADLLRDEYNLFRSSLIKEIKSLTHKCKT